LKNWNANCLFKIESTDNYMKKTMIVLAICMAAVFNVQAQSNVGSTDYRTSLGVKFYPGAITLKHFISDRSALEGLAYFHWGGTRITGLYELHYNIEGVPGLQWYIGPGAHIGFYGNKYADGTQVGLDGVLGLDYKIRQAPLNLSLDWQPSFEFGSGRGFYGGWGGLSVRYVF
jgi:hypothetical protein